MKLNVMLSGYSVKSIPALFLIISLLTTFSCHKESNPATQYAIPANLEMIGAGYASGAATKVVIYATQHLYVGYNKVYIALYDSVTGARITQSQVSLSSQGAGGVEGPVENPAAATATNGLFDAAVVFVNSGNWTVATNVQNISNGRAGGFTAPVTVTQTTPAKSYSLTTADGSNLFVSIVQPAQPQLGVNNFELVVNRQLSATTYAPDSTYMVALNPTMPAMSGMNSPNNVNPVYAGNGHYTGKVDFIMSGGWNVYVDLARNGTLADTSHYFTLILL